MVAIGGFKSGAICMNDVLQRCVGIDVLQLLISARMLREYARNSRKILGFYTKELKYFGGNLSL